MTTASRNFPRKPLVKGKNRRILDVLGDGCFIIHLIPDKKPGPALLGPGPGLGPAGLQKGGRQARCRKKPAVPFAWRNSQRVLPLQRGHLSKGKGQRSPSRRTRFTAARPQMMTVLPLYHGDGKKSMDFPRNFGKNRRDARPRKEYKVLANLQDREYNINTHSF